MALAQVVATGFVSPVWLNHVSPAQGTAGVAWAVVMAHVLQPKTAPAVQAIVVSALFVAMVSVNPLVSKIASIVRRIVACAPNALVGQLWPAPYPVSISVVDFPVSVSRVWPDVPRKFVQTDASFWMKL